MKTAPLGTASPSAKAAAPSAPASAGGLDPERLREDFPILHRRLNGKPLVYLDNAATTQKPRAVIDAVRRYYESDNANIHRGVHELSVRATEQFEGARTVVQRFLGAAEAREIIFTRGTTEAINLVAATYGRRHVGPGDEVIVSLMEHHSNIVPWQLLCEEKGAVLHVIPISDSGELLLEEFDRLLGPRTKLVSVVHVSNALGTVNPVGEIVRRAHRRGVPVLVDGAQAVPHLPVSVRELDCDFYAFSGHKVFGPTGIGVLYGKADLLRNMPPYQGGGDMITSVSFQGSSYKDIPHKFEAGTPHIAGAIGLAAAIEYVTGIGLNAIAAYEGELLEYATQALSGIRGVRLIGTAEHKASVLSFVLDCAHPHDVGTILNEEGLAIRTGHHCAQPVMERYGIPATARASLAFYNTRADIDALVAGVHKVIKRFG
jgi:cysteine desulfurase/selenocysteine lyase